MTRINSITSPDLVRLPMRESQIQGRQRGFSLIELMVTLVLGTIIVAGMISLFTSSKQSFQAQSGDNNLQQNLRFATDRLGWVLRMTDFWGGDSINAGNLTV